MKLAAVFLSVAALLAISGCVDGPREVGASSLVSSQKKVSTLQHWQMIAKVSAQDVGKDPTCIMVAPAPTAGETKFQAFLENQLTTELVGGPSTVNYGYAPKCDRVSIESIYVRHNVYKAMRFPGQYTILAAGLVLVRDVAEAFNFPRAIGLVALGEGAFWSGAGLHGHGDMAEIAVTASRVTSDGVYVTRVTNVYYIDERESRLYDSESRSNTSKNLQLEPPEYLVLAGAAARQVVTSLPQLDGCTVQSHGPPCPAELAAPTPVSRGPAFGKLQVSPATISNCDTAAGFVVMGNGLSDSELNYRFGPIVASKVTRKLSVVPPADMKDPFDVLQVSFEHLQTANRGLDTIPLTAETSTGAAAYDVSIKGSCAPAPTEAKNPVTVETPNLAGSWILDIPKSKFGAGQVCTSGSRVYALTSAKEESLTASTTCGKGSARTVSYAKAEEDGTDVAVTDSLGQAVTVAVERMNPRITSAVYKSKGGATLWTETCTVAANGKDLTVTQDTESLLYHRK